MCTCLSRKSVYGAVKYYFSYYFSLTVGTPHINIESYSVCPPQLPGVRPDSIPGRRLPHHRIPTSSAGAVSCALNPHSALPFRGLWRPMRPEPTRASTSLATFSLRLQTSHRLSPIRYRFVTCRKTAYAAVLRMEDFRKQRIPGCHIPPRITKRAEDGGEWLRNAQYRLQEFASQPEKEVPNGEGVV